MKVSMMRTSRHVREFLTVSVSVLIVCILAATTSFAPAVSFKGDLGVFGAVAPQAVGLAGTLVSETGATLFASQLYNSFEQTPTGAKSVDVSALPPASTVATGVMALFNQVSREPGFLQLLDSTGPGGFGYGFAGNVATGLSSVYFDFNSVGPSTTTTISWQGNLLTGTISGPYVETHATISMNSVFQSGNWAGSSWWGSGSPTPTLKSTGFDEKYPTMSTSTTQPTNLPSGDSVSQEAAIWVGLTNSNDYLLQTGAYTDVSAGGSGGQIFYELACPSGHSCPNSAYYYPTGGGAPATLQVVPVGDYARNVVWQGSSSTNWNLEVYDWSSGNYNSVNWNLGTWLPSGYSPQWTQYIVETPESGGLFQQLPSFSEVIIGDDFYCTGSTNLPCGWHSYGQPYNQYQLEQASSNDNTNQGYENVDCGYQGTYGCPTISYVNSDYNYNFLVNTYGTG
jgi:hypothetical protein